MTHGMAIKKFASGVMFLTINPSHHSRDVPGERGHPAQSRLTSLIGDTSYLEIEGAGPAGFEPVIRVCLSCFS